MDRETYRRYYDLLRTPADVDRLAVAEHVDRELLFIIHTQRVSRDATRRFYVVKRQMSRLVAQWRHGKRALDIARELDFPPVLLGQMILRELQLPRKQVWGCFLDPLTAPTHRLQSEVRDLLANDLVYSPEGMELQRERGRIGEARLYAWLDKHSIPYKTEKDLRGKFPKTPDALLEQPIIFYGQRLRWIESKANFGDDVELRKNLRRQLGPYTELFGEGAVVYWHGFVDGAESPTGILLWDAQTIEGLTPEVEPHRVAIHAAHPTSGHVRAPHPERPPEVRRSGPGGHAGGPPPAAAGTSSGP